MPRAPVHLKAFGSANRVAAVFEAQTLSTKASGNGGHATFPLSVASESASEKATEGFPVAVEEIV